MTKEDLDGRMIAFVRNVMNALGITAEVSAEPIGDGTRIKVGGEGADVLLRRKGEVLDALQHIVSAAFRHEHPGRHIVVDCLDFRLGRDAELRQTALLLAEKARTSGMPQEVGPLNPYARRIVHLAIAEDPRVTSESIGDAFLKTVVISAKK